MELTIVEETADKERLMPLLLMGDESADMIGRYLSCGRLFAGYIAGEPVAVCVATEEAPGLIEVKNLAVHPRVRRQGIGRRMLQHVGQLHPGCTLTLGTGETPSTLRFYRSCGFGPAYRIPDFFTRHYPAPIVEEGVTLRDMLYLVKPGRLCSERLTLRHWCTQDAPALYRYASDERVSRPAQWPVHTSEEMSRTVIEQYFMPQPFTFAMELRSTGEPIGCIGLVPEGEEHYPLLPGEREVGYWVGRPFWGMGLTPEALHTLIGFCTDTLRLSSLLITTIGSNTASQRVAGKCGFRHIADYTHPDGTPLRAYRLTLPPQRGS